MSKLTAELANELFDYDPETGVLTKKATGQPVGCRQQHGHLRCKYKFKSYYVHRIIWLIAHGKWPKHQIDHINGIADDNRLCNLRDVSALENGRNQKQKSNNKTGVTGVLWNKKVNKLHACIRVCGKMHHLGYFDRLEDAVWMRKLAEKEFGFHKNHGRESMKPKA